MKLDWKPHPDTMRRIIMRDEIAEAPDGSWTATRRPGRERLLLECFLDPPCIEYIVSLRFKDDEPTFETWTIEVYHRRGISCDEIKQILFDEIDRQILEKVEDKKRDPENDDI